MASSLSLDGATSTPSAPDAALPATSAALEAATTDAHGEADGGLAAATPFDDIGLDDGVAGQQQERRQDGDDEPTTPRAYQHAPGVAVGHVGSTPALEPAEPTAASNGDSPASDRRRGRPLGHARLDSVPPQRYHLDADAESQQAVAVEPSRVVAGGSTIARPGLEPWDEAGVGSGDEELSLERGQPDASLGFVDIRLEGVGLHDDPDGHDRDDDEDGGGGDRDAPGVARFPSPYGVGGVARFASRSSHDIRNDSISSSSDLAKRMAKQQRKQEQAEERERQRQQAKVGLVSATAKNGAPHPTPPGTEGGRRGSHVASTDEPGTPPGSHTAAPPPAPPGMVVMGENGELHVVPVDAQPGPSSASPGHRDSPASSTEVEAADRTQPSEESPRGTSMQATATSSTNDAKEAPRPPEADPATDADGADVEPTQMDEVVVDSAGVQLRDVADAAPPKSGGLGALFGASRRHSRGPSALEQHLSKTRMTTLPPKPRAEDQRHLDDFERIMRDFKQAERRRAEEDEVRRRRRDEERAEDLRVWQQEILPSWTRARREPELRAVWCKGAPPNVRGRAWALACGNAQMLPRNLFAHASARARRADAEGRFPRREAEAIERDVARTLPSLKLFQRDTGPLYDDLRDVLRAHVMYLRDGAGDASASSSSSPLPSASSAQAEAAKPTRRTYRRGTACLAAMLLANLSPAETLVALINLVAERPWLRALYAAGGRPARRRSHGQTVGGTGASGGGDLNGGDGRRGRPPSTRSHGVASSADGKDGEEQEEDGEEQEEDGEEDGEDDDEDEYDDDNDDDAARTAAGYDRVFDTLLADQLPKCYANLQARGVRASHYVRRWIRTLFVPYLPFDAAARLWDCILLEEGEALLFRAALALMQLLSSRLHVPDRRELMSVLRGNNRAALHVYYRSQATSTSPRSSRHLDPQAASRAADALASPSAVAAATTTSTAPPPASSSSPLARQQELGTPSPRQNQVWSAPPATTVDPARGKAPATASSRSSRSGSGDGRSVVSGSHARGSTTTAAAAAAGGSSPVVGVEADDSLVPLDEIYAQYAVDEAAVFGALEHQLREGWRDSTVERLLDRELGG